METEQQDNGVFDEVNDNIDNNHVEPNGSEETQGHEQTPTQTTPVQFTPDDIKNAVTQGMMQAGQQQQQGQRQEPLTQEQIDRALKVWRPNEEFAGNFVKSLQPDEEGKVNASEVNKLIMQMRDGMMTESQTFAQALVRQEMQRLQSEYSPLLQEQQTRQQAESIKAFTSKYKAFEPYQNLIPIAAQQLKNSGFHSNDANQTYTALASTLENMIKQFNPNFKAGAPSGNTGTVTPATVSNQAGGGGGGKPANPNKKSANIW